jgi:hypothetical protein
MTFDEVVGSQERGGRTGPIAVGRATAPREAASWRAHDHPSGGSAVTLGGWWLGVMARRPQHLLPGGNPAPPVWVTYESSALRQRETIRHPLPPDIPSGTRGSTSLGSGSCCGSHPAPRLSAPLNSDSNWRKSERRVRSFTEDPAADAPRTGCRTRDIRRARQNSCAVRAA